VLKMRVISALIMAPLVIYGVLFLDDPAFTSILGAVMLAGVWEWSHLIPLKTMAVRIIYTAAIAALSAAANFSPSLSAILRMTPAPNLPRRPAIVISER